MGLVVELSYVSGCKGASLGARGGALGTVAGCGLGAQGSARGWAGGGLPWGGLVAWGLEHMLYILYTCVF